MDWTEEQQCLQCNTGGKLLVCTGDGCPISVHESCMGCKAHLDDAGNFHCPYCLYKRLTAEAFQLREKVMLTKKALSTFLEKQTSDGNKEEHVSSKERVDATDGNNPVCDEDLQNQFVDLEKSQHSKTSSPCEETHETLVSKQTGGVNNVNPCLAMVIYHPNSNHVDEHDLDPNVSKRVRVDNRTGNVKCKFDEVVHGQQHGTSKESVAQSNVAVNSSSKEKQIGRQKRNYSVAFNKNDGNGRKEECMMQSKTHGNINNQKSDSLLNHQNGGKEGSLEPKISAASRTEIIKNSNLEKNSSKEPLVTDRRITLPSQIGSHRLFWSEEEVDMIKEGVEKFSKLTRKNLPWKKILDFGRHVFDSSRTPADLKDKWRKMVK